LSDKIDLARFDSATPFLSRDFILTWLDCYADYIHEMIFFVFYAQTDIVAIAPFYIKKSRKKEVRFICSGENEEDEVCSECLDVLLDNNDRQAILPVLMDALLENSEKWDVLIVDNYVDDSFVSECLLPALATQRHSIIKKTVGLRYYLDLPDSIDSFYAQKKGSFYSGLRRKYRKLNRDPQIRLELKADIDNIDHLMQRLKELHNSRWRASGVRGVFESDIFFEFHKKLSHRLIRNDSLFMLVIRDAEQIFSIEYGFIFKGTLYFYQSGHIPEKYTNLSVGSVSHIISIEYAIQHGLSVYDFMLGSASSYKNKFKCITRPMYMAMAYQPGLYGKYKILTHKLHQLNR